MDNNAAASTSAGASTSAQPAPSPAPGPSVDMVGVLGNLLKSHGVAEVTNESMAQLLMQNMATLVQQGKLTQSQLLQVNLVSYERAKE